MNVEELNEVVKNNQKRNLEETIKDIERKIIWRGSNDLNNFEIATDRDSYDLLYTINKWMLEPLKDYFISNDYKVTVKEIKDPMKWFDKMLGIYEPEYSMIIRW